MKYEQSKDGLSRCTIRVNLRITHDEVVAIKHKLRKMGKPFDDKSVRAFVINSVEFDRGEEPTYDD